MLKKNEEIQTPKKQILYFHAYCIGLQKVASLYRKKCFICFTENNKQKRRQKY